VMMTDDRKQGESKGGGRVMIQMMMNDGAEQLLVVLVQVHELPPG
jgi:hypothetical protein